MKVAAIRFYQEVTGTKGSSNHAVMKSAFTRWGVPYEFGEHAQGNKSPRMYVDPMHAEPAKKLYAIEQAAMEQRKAKKQASMKPKKPNPQYELPLPGAKGRRYNGLQELIGEMDVENVVELLRDMNKKLDRILDIWTK